MTEAQSKEARRAQIRMQLGHPSGTRSSEIRAGLDHPVIDSDGHILEFEAGVVDHLKAIAGPDLAERFKTGFYRNTTQGNLIQAWESAFNTREENLDQRITLPSWWGLPTKRTFDRAAAALPGLLHDCLEEAGIDFAVLYPTLGLLMPCIEEDEMRQAACRAVNIYNAEVLKDHADRLTGVAVIPMNTPEEAITELEFAVKELKFKCVMLQSFVMRPIPKIAREHPEIARYTSWMDNYCLDSPYDYDPVWTKCVELGVSPTFHTPNYSMKRASPTNWVFNHMGVFASGGELVCRSLLMGGVPHRFPSLRFGFLEGGVAWATTLYADAIGHWHKRNKDVIQNYDPANLDKALFLELHRQYGGSVVQQNLDRVGKPEIRMMSFGTQSLNNSIDRDEFAASGIGSAEDIKSIFDRFYFGCEADDPTNAMAFNDRVNPLGAKLNAVLSSDIGHFDVQDISGILEEAYELLEHELISEEDFRRFTFTNPVGLWTDTNPDFFTGTAIEAEVAKAKGKDKTAFSTEAASRG